MIVISNNVRDLVGEIIGVCTHSIEGDYPTEYQTYDEAWDNLHRSLAHLQTKLGEDRYAQLVEMAVQAKAHFDKGYIVNDRTIEVIPGYDHIKLGARLMQDMEQVVKGKSPYAYPEELYRWSRGATLN